MALRLRIRVDPFGDICTVLGRAWLSYNKFILRSVKLPFQVGYVFSSFIFPSYPSSGILPPLIQSKMGTQLLVV
jgi:hypothetical protein